VSRLRPLVLVVDDEAAIRDGLAAELRAADYDVADAADGAEGLARFDELAPDLVLVDLAMPRVSGWQLVRAVRERATTPIVVLSVRGEEEDKVRALDSGADDYVTKPFSVPELLARVRAQLRRSGGSAAMLAFAGLTIDREKRRVTVEGRDVRLTPTELAILELLALNAGKPVSAGQIAARVWSGGEASDDTVRVHVGTLRRKLEPDPARPRFLVTEPWLGYRFIAEPLDGGTAASAP
jgi:two-component system KDP operon response regulator KdpE